MPETLIAVEDCLDLRSAAINAPKGSLSNCLNFEKDQGPGVVRRAGWVRYDGRVCGPEVEDGVVCFFNNSDLTGTFTYGEQVSIDSAGYPKLTAIYIGNSGPYASFSSAIVLAYPIQTFPEWYDLTQFPTNTQITGLSSGAILSSLLFSPTLMNGSTITVGMFNNLKQNIQQQHASAVLAVPGRNESPVDCAFTYGDNSYAIHDCVTFTFNTGTDDGTNIYPLEGHIIKATATGNILGTLLLVKTTSGDWASGNMTGQLVVYDYPLGQAFPVAGDRLDLYSADGTTLLVAEFARFVSAAASSADPSNTRALLYETYEQYVKSYPQVASYGKSLVAPPKWQVPAPPTWTRPRITRELPYTCVGLPANSQSFGPTGSNDYSIYEYSRLGLTTQLQALVPQNTGEKFPTVATDPSTVRWINPNNIKLQDGAVTNYNPITGNIGFVTVPLIGTGFDFSSIPDGSQILGVVFRVRASANAVNNWIDNEVRLVSDAFQNGVSSLNMAKGNLTPVALTDFTYGSSTDTWGEQLTTDIIKDPSFGVQIKWKKNNAAALSTVYMDCYALTVYYAPVTRTVWIRNPAATTAEDIVANIIHYCIDSGDFATQTATGVLTVLIGTDEWQGTAAGKSRRLKAGDEIRTAPSTSGTNAANGTLLAYVAAEDYPQSYPPSVALDNNISRYEVIDANFWDVPEGRAAYIVNGVEYATMWDGTFSVRIRTGRPAANDNPRHVAAHLGYLHLGFQSGAVVNTGTGKPLSVLGVIGAAVYNFGEPITGMLTLNGQTLGVWTDRATRGLQGNSPTTAGGGSGYTPMMISPAINCIEYTLVNLVGQAVWASFRGVETVRTVNAYGDFETLPLSAAAQPWLQGRLQADLNIGSTPSRALYAIGIRNKRQYRLFFADGFVYTLTMFDAGDLPRSTIQCLYRPNATTVFTGANDYPTNAGVIRHVYNGPRSDGKEIILASFENQNTTIVPAAGGSNIGPYFSYAVRLDCGYMDDVAPEMPCLIEFNAIYPAFPNVDNQWQSGTVYMNAYGGTQLTFYTKFDFDGPIFEAIAQRSALIPFDPLVRSQSVTLPLVEAKAYIPVPQRFLKFDPNGESRMLKLLIDGTQPQAAQAPALMPLRITHLSFTTSEPLTTDKT